MFGRLLCSLLGHAWQSAGGRLCPRNGNLECSQTVYHCPRCDQWDYGEPGGPAHRECFLEGPCDPYHCLKDT